MPDEYEKVARGKLKLKTDGEISKKKKKKRDKEKELEKVAYVDPSTVQIAEPSAYERKLTKAEQSFKKMQDKMVRFRTSLPNTLILNPKFLCSKRNESWKKLPPLTSSKSRSSTRSWTI